MKIESKYPLLLTLIERRYLHHHYHDERTSGDVYRALYLQGEHLKDDRVVNWRPVAIQADLDERGIGWKDSHSCWISQGGQILQVDPVNQTCSTRLPEGLASCSGRYRWTLEQQETTKLKQLDQQTGQLSTIWEQPGWARVDMASDPTRDRLVWSHNGPLRSWNPTQNVSEIVPCKFSQDFSELRFSPDGQSLAFVHDQQVYNLNQGNTHCISGPRSNSFNYRLQPEWSPDSKRVFYISAHFDIEDETMRETYQWMVARADGTERRTLNATSAVAAAQVGPSLNETGAWPI